MLDSWAGEPAVFKFRKPLAYRLPELDRSIRAHRTVHEAETIHQARRSGVRTPYLYYVGPAEALLVMEYVAGKRLKQLLWEDGDHSAEMSSFGKVVGILHGAGIMHGDLTTSNVIVNDDDHCKLTVIDFGLALHSQKVEDHAVDLRLIKETLNGAHSKISVQAFASFLEGYGGEVGADRVAAVRKTLAEIERRGRYARVE